MTADRLEAITEARIAVDRFLRQRDLDMMSSLYEVFAVARHALDDHAAEAAEELLGAAEQAAMQHEFQRVRQLLRRAVNHWPGLAGCLS